MFRKKKAELDGNEMKLYCGDRNLPNQLLKNRETRSLRKIIIELLTQK